MHGLAPRRLRQVYCVSLLLSLLHLVLAAYAFLVALPATILCTEILLALLPRRRDPRTDGTRPRIAVLVPAHNESTGVLPTLSAITAQLSPGDRLVVIADNCSDDTAAVAQAAGAEVTERRHLQLRGKSYALDHGVKFLRADPPSVVIVIDADCTLGDHCLERLARMSCATGGPVQGKFLTLAANDSLKMRVAEFAMRVNAHVRQRGLHRVGLACRLTGSGIAYPWLVVKDAPLASGHLAEDMQLGLVLGRQGTPPAYCEDAYVQTVFPGSAEAQTSQRTRWEHGHLSVIVHDVPPLLLQSVIRGQFRYALQVLDLLVPPIALLAMLLLAAVVLGVTMWWAFGWLLPLLIATIGALLLTVAISVARAAFASDLLSIADLLRVPSYVTAKLPLYARFIVRRQVEWVRTKRDAK